MVQLVLLIFVGLVDARNDFWRCWLHSAPIVGAFQQEASTTIFGRAPTTNELVNRVATIGGRREGLGLPSVPRGSGGSPSFGVGALFRRNRKWASTARLAANRRLCFGLVIKLGCGKLVSEGESCSSSGLGVACVGSFPNLQLLQTGCWRLQSDVGRVGSPRVPR